MILSCKGCCYFRAGLLGNYCDYYTSESYYTDPISLQKYIKRSGETKAEIIRATSGECGPDRKLYDTYTNQFRRWIKGKLYKIFSN